MPSTMIGLGSMRCVLLDPLSHSPCEEYSYPDLVKQVKSLVKPLDLRNEGGHSLFVRVVPGLNPADQGSKHLEQ